MKVLDHVDLDEVGGIRASVQLALIAAALHGVLAAPATSIAVIAVMFNARHQGLCVVHDSIDDSGGVCHIVGKTAA